MLDKLSLNLYLLLTFLFLPFVKIIVIWRIYNAKEHPTRWREKLGKPNLARPSGKLIWLHAVGLGEVLALRGLIEELHKNEEELNFLVTSSTVLSADVFEKNSMPKTIHQFLPYDLRIFCKRFLRHWSPDFVIWSEQDIWPGMSSLVSKFGIKQVLVNGRMTKESFSRRNKIKPLHRVIYQDFEFIAAQDLSSKKLYEKLGASCTLRTDGSLKPHCPPLVFEEDKLKIIKRATCNTKVWVLGSSHAEDEKIAIQTKKLLKDHNIKNLLVLIPRYPNRRKEIIKSLKNFKVRMQSKGEIPNQKTEVYVADSIGEIGLWYKASKVVFIGGTFSSVEGHNPWEAVNLDCTVIFGPRISNFNDDFKLLERLNLASQITSSKDLFEVLSRKNDVPISKCLTKLKTKLEKDINILVKDLLLLINN
tara:strand:+ start:25 stop:1281 length:1257 start_codon:yes stop_codon:yes gene_type:complete